MDIPPSRTHKSSHLSRAAALAILGLAAAQADAAVTNMTYKVEVGVKETFDSNVYLQDNAPNPANVAAARAAGSIPCRPIKTPW